MTKRIEAIHRWLEDELGFPEHGLTPASSDASFRRYFRCRHDSRTHIVMDAPPRHQPTGPYLDVTARLLAAGINVPRVLALDLEQGFLLLSDLGDEQYLQRLNTERCKTLYADALDSLFTMQLKADTEGLPDYEAALLLEEMALFRDWYLGRHLGIELSSQQKWVLRETFHLLAGNALEQPRRFVHRDYHSRNLMWLAENNPGVLDFQDAVLGPITYDLVSLLRDCYIAWPDEMVASWMEEYRQRLLAAKMLPDDVTGELFTRWFDLMGVQRHLKATGIFARLNYRDGKPGYLKDIPRTMGYIHRVAPDYPELEPFRELLLELGIKPEDERANREAAR